MKKETVIIVCLVIIGFLIGMFVFNKTNNQQKTTGENKMVVSIPTEKIVPTTGSPIITVPVPKVTVSDSSIDSKLKDLNNDAANVDKSFSDQSINVNQ